MKKLFAILLFSLVCASAFAQSKAGQDAKPAVQGLSASPGRLLFKLDRGKTATQQVTVENGTSKKQFFSIKFMDWVRDTVGAHLFAPLGESKNSCAPWVKFDKPTFELEPGQTTSVAVTMTVPDTDSAVMEMKWTMLLIQAVFDKPAPVRAGAMGVGVDQTFGLGIHITQVPPNVTNKELKMVSFSELAGRDRYRVICKNIGAMELYTTCTLELSSAETGKKTTLQLSSIPLFPQQERYYDFTLPKELAKGKYTAVALVDAGDDDVPIEAAQKEIIVK